MTAEEKGYFKEIYEVQLSSMAESLAISQECIRLAKDAGSRELYEAMIREERRMMEGYQKKLKELA